jgi:hypothetical protein
VAFSAALIATGVWAQPFEPLVPLGMLNGQSGFRIDGASPGGQSGSSLAATGDFNGDGLVDLAIGAPNTAVTRAGLTGFRAGEVFVLFGGRSGIEHGFDLNRLRAASGGDGRLGYVLQGEFYQGEAVPDEAGTAVANAGDMNGDGIDDLLVGAIGRGTGFGENLANRPQGAAYLIFGRLDNDPLPPEFDLGRLQATGTNNENSGFGVILHGSQVNGQVGFVVAGIGDFNGDGRQDVFVGNQIPFLGNQAFGGGLNNVRGESYVIYGRATGSPWPAEVELAELGNGGGAEGFAIKDETSATSLGAAAAGIGDFTGDGRDDLLIGAYSLFRTSFDPFDPGGRQGAAVIIPGLDNTANSGFGGLLDLADVENQPTVHRLLGPLVDFVQVGKAVAGIGDINGDGRPDIAIAGLYRPADIPGQQEPVRPPEADFVYVLFGRAANNPLPQTFELANLLPANGGNGRTGFVIAGLPEENIGSAIAGIGDVNGDGRTDLLLGASGKSGNARGGAYVLYGRAANDPFPALFSLSELGNGQRGFALEGEQDGDTAGVAVAAAGDLNGDGSTDFLVGAQLANSNSNNTGSTYAVFGAGNDAVLQINANTSGPWFNVDQSGHGWLIEVLESVDGQAADRVNAYWYVYQDGAPVWLIGSGPITGSSTTLDMIIASGPSFPPNYDPNDLVVIPWGTLTFELTSETTGTASWSSSLGGFGSGTLDMAQIAPLSDGPDGCQSGTFFDPAQNGHGFVAEVVSIGGDESLILAWFVYLNGEQVWMFGQGAIADGVAVVPMGIFSGADFPPDFTSTEVINDVWGTVTMTFTGPDTAAAIWNTDFPGYTGGTIDLIRLTGLAGHGCP